jgi:hypothetical protein
MPPTKHSTVLTKERTVKGIRRFQDPYDKQRKDVSIL